MHASPPSASFQGPLLQGPLVLALPKGRILAEIQPLLEAVGIRPDPSFEDPQCRALDFQTNDPGLNIIRVRSFDVATFVAFGAAHVGIAGNDVLMEFNYEDIYAPVNLGVGQCRLAVAEPESLSQHDDPRQWSHIRVATKYPNLTTRHFAARGVQSECIKLNGAVELAPRLGLCRRIVDLVSTGATLRSHNLIEVETIAQVTSRLIVHRTALKLRHAEVQSLIDRFTTVAHHHAQT